MRLPEAVLFAAPARYPVSLAEAKNHCRLESDFTEDDALIDAAIAMATEQAELRTGRQLITATYDFYFDGFPYCRDARGELAFEILRPKLQSIISIKYVQDSDGTLATLDTAAYRVDTTSVFGRAVLAYRQSWPTGVRSQSNSVVIRAVCGYGDNMGDVPQSIRNWMLVRIGTAYENREALADRQTYELQRPFIDGLLDAETVRSII